MLYISLLVIAKAGPRSPFHVSREGTKYIYLEVPPTTAAAILVLACHFQPQTFHRSQQEKKQQKQLQPLANPCSSLRHLHLHLHLAYREPPGLLLQALLLVPAVVLVAAGAADLLLSVAAEEEAVEYPLS